METLLICVLCTFAHVPSLILRYLPFACIVDKKKRKLLLGIYGAALLLNGMLYAWLAEEGLLTISFYKINLLLFCMVMAAVNILVLPGYLQEHLFTFGLVAILVLMMTAGTAFLVDLIGYNGIHQGLIYSNLWLIGMFLVLYLPLARLMIHTVTPFLNLDGKDYWNTIWFIPVSMFFASLFSQTVDSYTSSVRQLISKLLLGIATIFICRSVARGYERLAENQSLNQQMDDQKQYYRALSEKMKAEQEARHNYKHHVAVMKQFLEDGKTDSLKAYIRQFVEEQPRELPIPHTGNAATDGILMHYMQLSMNEGIRFESRCLIPEQGYQDIDVCNLLGNALDNAVTAARATEHDPWIKIVTEIKSNMLLISVSNSFDGLVQTKNNHILSKKRVMQEGIGIYTMKSICEKYHGLSDFTWENHEFRANFMLVARN